MKVPRELQSIGIGVFIDEYEFWLSKQSLDVAIEYQLQKGISNVAGATRRACAAKKIFADRELLQKCLAYIAYHAVKIATTHRVKAKEYLLSISVSKS